MRPKQAEAAGGVSRPLLFALLREPEINPFKINGCRMICAAEIEAYRARQK